MTQEPLPLNFQQVVYEKKNERNVALFFTLFRPQLTYCTYKCGVERIF